MQTAPVPITPTTSRPNTPPSPLTATACCITTRQATRSRNNGRHGNRPDQRNPGERHRPQSPHAPRGRPLNSCAKQQQQPFHENEMLCVQHAGSSLLVVFFSL